MVSRGKVLELLRPDEGGKMQTILATEVFGAIRSLMPFRLTGASRDYVIIGSESGRIVIVEYSKEKNLFIKVRRVSALSRAARGPRGRIDSWRSRRVPRDRAARWQPPLRRAAGAAQELCRGPPACGGHMPCAPSLADSAQPRALVPKHCHERWGCAP
jgi:hypothetical protein